MVDLFTPDRFKKKPLWATLCLIFSAAVTLSPAHAQEPDPDPGPTGPECNGDCISFESPFDGGYDKLGGISELPLVQYNELNGSMTMPIEVGVEGLMLPFNYNDNIWKRSGARVGVEPPSSCMDGTDVFGDTVVDQDCPYGTNAHVGFGYLEVKKPWLIDYSKWSSNTSDKGDGLTTDVYRPIDFMDPRAAGQVNLVDSGGSLNGFVRDYVFGDFPANGRALDSQWVDSSLQVIKRDPLVNEASQNNIGSFTHANFYLHNSDGDKIVYEPVYRAGSGKLLSDDPASMRYYPVKVIRHNGQVLTLKYNQPLKRDYSAEVSDGNGGGVNRCFAAQR